jgi:hypothetical protein
MNSCAEMSFWGSKMWKKSINRVRNFFILSEWVDMDIKRFGIWCWFQKCKFWPKKTFQSFQFRIFWPYLFLCALCHQGNLHFYRDQTKISDFLMLRSTHSENFFLYYLAPKTQFRLGRHKNTNVFDLRILLPIQSQWLEIESPKQPKIDTPNSPGYVEARHYNYLF